MKDSARQQPATKESQCENANESKLSKMELVSDRLWKSTVCEVVMKVSEVSELDVLAMNDH